MKIIFFAILLLHFLPGNTQKIVIVKFNCADSVRYVSNQGPPLDCEFSFDSESPDIFYAENFTHQDFFNVVLKNDKSKLARVKLVTPKYTPAVHDFVFTMNKNNGLLYYYILKDSQEEEKLSKQPK